MSDTVIRVEQVAKQYRLGEVGTGTLRHDFNRWWHRVRGKEDPYAKVGETNRPDSNGDGDWFWALKDISFDVKRGEVLGIIGKNGAGKSTLLKILSRVTTPTRGEVKVKGRIASLLEVGTGFHPELTGRENIYLNGAILGMRKREIERKLDEIIDFSGCERFIDTPVKRYSSGMYVRLAFAVAAHLEPEILIVDEVLAVGDVEFQNKCLGKMKDVSSQDGRTVLFVSHNLQAIQTLCARGLLLNSGVVICDAEPSSCVELYTQLSGRGSDSIWTRQANRGSKCLEFEELQVELRGKQPNICLHLRASLRTHSTHKLAFVAFDILDSLGISIMQALPRSEGFLHDQAGRHDIDVEVELPPLIPGRYGVTSWVGPHNTLTYDQVENVLSFTVEDSPDRGRTFPHTADHGHVIPPSRVTEHRETA